MPYRVQKSFSSGEISPDLYARNDFGPAYDSAVAEMKNMICSPLGPTHSRKGFEYIDTLENVTGVRVFPFDVSVSQSFAVAISPEKIKVFDKSGGGISGAERSVNGDFDLPDPDTDWNAHWRVVFSDGLCYIPGPTTSDSSYISLPKGFVWQEVTGLSIGLTYRFIVNAKEITKTIHVIIGTTDEDSGEILDTTSNDLNFSYTFVATTTNVFIKVDVPDFVNWPSGEPNLPPVESANFEFIKLEDVAFSSEIEFASPYILNDLYELEVDRPPNGQTLYIMHRRVPAYKLVYDIISKVWSFTIVSFTKGTEPTLPWQINSVNEHPGAIAFYQGRLWLAGTNEEQTTLWGSQPNDYENFDIGAQSLPSDSLIFPLDKYGEIKWLSSHKSFMVGFESGEHIISSVGGVLAIDDGQARQQSAYGSSRIQPVLSHEKTIFAGVQRRIIRAMDYERDVDGLSSTELTFTSEHLTKGRIKEIHHALVLDTYIYVLLEDGTYIGATVEFARGILGWHKHNTLGNIKSMAVLKESGIDNLYALVHRPNSSDAGGTFDYYFEKYNPESNIFLDSCKTVSFASTTVNFPGFDHLADQIVVLIVDDVISSDTITVPSNGIIVLSTAAKKVTAGYAFERLLRTLPVFEDGSVNTNNSTFDFKKKYTDIFVQVLDSKDPIINGKKTFKRSKNTPMNTIEPNRTEFIRVAGIGWDDTTQIEVKQDQPVNLSILAIGGKLHENKP